MKKNKYSNKVFIFTVLLAATTLLSCTNRVNLLGARQQKQEINDFSESDEYETIEMNGLTIDNETKTENEIKLEKLKQIAEKTNNTYVFKLIEEGRIDPSLITYDKLAKFEENSYYISECKKNEDRINAQFSTKCWKSRRVIIPGLCLVAIGSVFLVYRTWYSDPLWTCFQQNGEELVYYMHNIYMSPVIKKMTKDLGLYCYQQPQKLITIEEVEEWSSDSIVHVSPPYFKNRTG